MKKNIDLHFLPLAPFQLRVTQLVGQFLSLETPKCAGLALSEFIHGVEDPLGGLLDGDRRLSVVGAAHVGLDPAGMDAREYHVLHLVGESRGEHV